MKVLIFGGQGMLGHMLVRYLRACGGCRVQYTTRDSKSPDGLYADAKDTLLTEKIVEAVRPDVVINCIGLLNQFAEAAPREAYWVNGIFPHVLQEAVARFGGRLIHVSTDCVFSGSRGGHTELEEPDGTSVYARSKALGEVTSSPHLTIRTSIIGPDTRPQGIGLLKWFLAQSGEISGYSRAWWNGVTTLELAKFIHYALGQETLHGLLHLHAPEPISKYELLKLFQRELDKRDVEVREDSSYAIDRTLSSVRSDIDYEVPNYDQMLRELRDWMWAT